MKSSERKKPRPPRKIKRSEFSTESPLQMTDAEWRKLSTHLSFKSGEEGTARRKIDSLLLAFEIAEVERLNEPVYKKKLEAMAKVCQKLDRELSEMQEIALERVVRRQDKALIIKHHIHALPNKTYLQKIREIIGMLQAEMATAISQLSNKHGPNTSLIHLLVERLNEIVVEHSTGGALRQSDKRNGLELVAAVLKIAGERSKSTIKNSMARQAIRGLKEKEKNLEAVETFGFDVDIPSDDLDHDDPKSILERGLAIAKQLRFCF